jgi:flagellar biosynthesis protein FlhF
MKMQKYTAPDMRSALRKVRAEHGPDALILFTRRSAGVVELTVATDPEAASRVGALTPARQVVGGEPMPTVLDMPIPTHAPLPPGTLSGAAAVTTMTAVPEIVPGSGTAAATATAVPSAAAIDGELKALRRLLETQLAALAWNDLTRRAPATTEMIREFATLGIDRELAAGILGGLPPTDDLSAARGRAREALIGRLAALEDTWTEQGGTLVLVGPAGAGKTSALAAIAARWVLRNGPTGAALISAGDNRFGAFDHLARLGRLLGLPTYRVDDAAEVPGLVARLGGTRLILVDTPAPSARDGSAGTEEQRFAALRALGTIAVTLPATMQAQALRLTAMRYARLGATACIATRLDEAASLGGLLSAVIGAGLPMAFVTDGTQLPDDLRPARIDDLVDLAFDLVARHGTAADEDLLTCRMEGQRDVAS